MPKQLTDDELDLVEGMSSRKAAAFLGVGKSTINDARARRATLAAQEPQEPRVATRRLLSGEVPEDRVTKRRRSEKDADGNWESVEWAPNGASTILEIARAATPEVVRPEFTAAPLVGQWKTAIVKADEQIGYRNDQPFHDETAITIGNAIVAVEEPDQIIHAGDFLDLATLGKYEQEPGFSGRMQASFDYGNVNLAVERAFAPNAEIIIVEGNHDRRMQRFATENAADVMHLKRAGSDDHWPALSVPGILRCQELGVQYMDAYPTSVWWINDNLRVIHGTKVNSNGSTAAMYAKETPHISTVFGHTHRQEIVRRTTFNRYDKIVSSFINPGCLCRIDGEVPSVKGAVGINGQSALNWEDWQQGIAVIRYKDSGEFRTELVEIQDGIAIHRGQEFTA